MRPFSLLISLDLKGKTMLTTMTNRISNLDIAENNSKIKEAEESRDWLLSLFSPHFEDNEKETLEAQAC